VNVLLAVDGSAHSLEAVRFLIGQVARLREPPAIELLTVHRPVPMLPGMGTVVSKADVERYYWEEGEQALGEAKRLLGEARVAFRSSKLVGEPGELIVKRANEGRFDLVCLGSPAKWIGSTTHKVLNHAEVPVLVVK
jgi:nucleotide-binding universal stress UspA family protein